VAAPPQTIESVLSSFLPRYSERFPNVQVRLIEALGHEQLALLERGEVHLGIRHDQGSDRRFESRALQADEVLAACALSLELGSAGMIDIGHLVRHPLLLLDAGYSVRKMFDAACRLAEIDSRSSSSRAPHMLALTEAGHGVAIIPSILATSRYALRIVRVAHRRKPLREGLIIQWDKRRPIPSYTESFCDLLAEHMSEVLPITQPSASNTAAAPRRAAARKTRRHTRKAG
jgi:DNA-binding transcriptional LysR family regulator